MKVSFAGYLVSTLVILMLGNVIPKVVNAQVAEVELLVKEEEDIQVRDVKVGCPNPTVCAVGVPSCTSSASCTAQTVCCLDLVNTRSCCSNAATPPPPPPARCPGANPPATCVKGAPVCEKDQDCYPTEICCVTDAFAAQNIACCINGTRPVL